VKLTNDVSIIHLLSDMKENNSFDGDIPSELGNIQTLQTIDLGKSRYVLKYSAIFSFRWKAPTQISCAILDKKGSNQLTFTIPSQIADIGALEYLDICE